MPAVADIHDGANGRGTDPVAVELALRVGNGVEFIGDILGGCDGNVGRKEVVQGLDEIRRGDRAVDVKMRDLAESVHTGIGPGGTDEFHRHTAQPAYRAFHCCLDSVEVGLPLPTMIGRSIVMDCQFDSSLGHFSRTQNAEHRTENMESEDISCSVFCFGNS